MRSLSKLPNFRWCAGDGCESGQIPSGSRNPKWKCRKCSACNCFNCKTLYHEMKTCQQYQRFKKVDGESLKTILKTTKGCPKRGCMRRVEKHKYCKDTFCETKGGCRFASSQTRPKPSARDQLYAEDWDKDPEYEAPDDLYVWDRT
ncbi:hypothetical protein BGZ57DRAFT_1003089 [Hyaloscypha finlandica]|nr:hypothetical protein BGZ57DRAFT_1003089 [Hyaloscypha finlandica]